MTLFYQLDAYLLTIEATDLGTFLVTGAIWRLVEASLEAVCSRLEAPGVLGALGIFSYRSRGSRMAGLTIGTRPAEPGLESSLSVVLTSPPVREAGLAATPGSESRTMTLTLDR